MTISAIAEPWVLTASGRALRLVDVNHDAISIRDIAAHLSKMCRFAGACATHYSIAQHSVLVSNMVAEHGPSVRLYGLLHDAHKAYVGELTLPARWALGRMQGDHLRAMIDIENRVRRAVVTAVGLPWPVPNAALMAIHRAGQRALATERRDVMPDGPDWEGLPAPSRGAIKPWPWAKAEEKFITQYADLATLANLPDKNGRGLVW